MTDFRALCDELLDEVIAGPLILDRELIARARAALADEPAVPEGREPASVTWQPSYDDLSKLCLQHGLDVDSWPLEKFDALWETVRAALSRWGNPAPQPPAKGEVAELVAWLREQAEHELGSTFDADYFSEDPAARRLNRAADLLQRLSSSQPQPVPVSERLPVAEDCDAEGRCWVWWKNGVRWVLDEWTHHELREGPLSDCVSHWLPAYALPVPEVGGCQGQRIAITW